MPFFKMSKVLKVLGVAALVAFVAVQATEQPIVDAPITETLAGQVFGTVTAEGSLVYSMNICTVVHSTNCEVSLSTGQAVETPSEYGPPAPTEGDGDENTNTPAEPTNGGAGETGGEGVTTEVLPTITETSSIYPTADSTTTDEQSTGYDETATSTTDGEEPSASTTDSAPPGESTAAAAHFGAPAIMLGAMVVGLI
ncbi:hypothetical protein N3K66_003782 [Trichothecium roseum]|uniref:Uncharacterized protein n=1 Tax=Trichothecium roseum TaxID=47278 RepID=A0ACC0V6G6_9HYPO|nr:hypothetical protein N3K66_003782 [Trichothecium roseum]